MYIYIYVCMYVNMYMLNISIKVRSVSSNCKLLFYSTDLTDFLSLP